MRGSYEKSLRLLPWQVRPDAASASVQELLFAECVDHYEAWLRAEVGKRKSWLDYLWSASLSVVPYALRP
jgi:hypothetical protein